MLIGGRTEGWIEPPEEEASSDIILAGQKWGGKVVVNVTLTYILIFANMS